MNMATLSSLLMIAGLSCNSVIMCSQPMIDIKEYGVLYDFYDSGWVRKIHLPTKGTWIKAKGPTCSLDFSMDERHQINGTFSGYPFQLTNAACALTVSRNSIELNHTTGTFSYKYDGVSECKIVKNELQLPMNSRQSNVTQKYLISALKYTFIGVCVLGVGYLISKAWAKTPVPGNIKSH